MPRVAVLKYPGTNCEEETAYALKLAGLEASIVWHEDFKWRGWDAIVIPGGFSYGDYVRAGVMATWTRSAAEVREAASSGVPVLGICNGFQILVEAGLLPGALLPNQHGRFRARWVQVEFEEPRGPWLLRVEEGRRYWMPIAHGEGRFYDVEAPRGRPVARYAEWNPNGSRWRVAGVGTPDGLVFAMMPHPERAVEPHQAPPGIEPGGWVVFESIASALREGW